MKLLPCPRCGVARAGEAGPLEAFEHGVRRTRGRGGLPYYMAAFPSGLTVLKWRCSACGSAGSLTPAEFNAIRDATPDELEACGVLDHVSKDHTLGGEVQLEEAKRFFLLGLQPVHTGDLHAAGISADDLAEMPPPEPRAA